MEMRSSQIEERSLVYIRGQETRKQKRTAYVAYNFELFESNKAGFGSQKHCIVTRGSTLFLRIVGNYPTFDVMTATASEDNLPYFVCRDRRRLNQSAYRFGEEMDTAPTFAKDSSGRDYVEICKMILRPSSPGEESDEAVLMRALGRFFEIFDATEPAASTRSDEMKDIYEACAPDDSGRDAYLGDGIWLSSDGSSHDRGR
jgi:hypothetical protein